MLIETKDYKKDMKLEKGVLYNGKTGVYRYADNKLYSAIIKVPAQYSGDELKESILSINLPKIPYSVFNKIYEFFKYVYKKHKTEVAVLLWYNFEKDTWDVEVPKQRVAGASVNYTRDESLSNKMQTDGFICVGSIHSHCEMSAFHSGTDDHDEYNFDGVHITIGKVLSGPEFAQRFIVKKMSTKFDKISDVVDMPEEYEIMFPNEWKEKIEKPTRIRKSSILGEGYSSLNYNMKFNRDGSLRFPKEETLEETDSLNQEVTEAEKIKRASRYYVDKLDAYRCPLCLENIPSHQVGKGYICPECGFPLYEDELEYDLSYGETGDEDKALAVKNFSDDELDNILNDSMDDYKNTKLDGYL